MSYKYKYFFKILKPQKFYNMDKKVKDGNAAS